jgi:hypothetical protein
MNFITCITWTLKISLYKDTPWRRRTMGNGARSLWQSASVRIRMRLSAAAREGVQQRGEVSQRRARRQGRWHGCRGGTRRRRLRLKSGEKLRPEILGAAWEFSFQGKTCGLNWRYSNTLQFLEVWFQTMAKRQIQEASIPGRQIQIITGHVTTLELTLTHWEARSWSLWWINALALTLFSHETTRYMWLPSCQCADTSSLFLAYLGRIASLHINFRHYRVQKSDQHILQVQNEQLQETWYWSSVVQN